MKFDKSLRLSLFLTFLTPVMAVGQRQIPFTDLPTSDLERQAISTMVSQGVMQGQSESKFAPSALMTRGDFAISMQRLFALKQPQRVHGFPDIPPDSPLSKAVVAVEPYLSRQIICFGCALADKFLPNAPVTRMEAAVILVNILAAQKKLSLVSSTAAESTLARFSDGKMLRGPLRVYAATAIERGVLLPVEANKLDPATKADRANTAVLLSGVQERFNLPKVRP